MLHLLVILTTSLPPTLGSAPPFERPLQADSSLQLPHDPGPRLDVFNYLTPPLSWLEQAPLAVGSPVRADALANPRNELHAVDEPPRNQRTPYGVNLILDGAITATAFALVGIAEFGLKPNMPGKLRCAVAPGQTRCDPSTLNALDRAVVGAHSEDWATITDIALGVAIGGAVLGVTLDALLSGSDTKARDLLTDLLVFTETVASVMLVTTGLKFAVRRDRPNHYDPSRDIGGADSYMSFPSGHTSMVGAAAFAFATNFWLRHPDSPWRWVVGAGAAGATALAGAGRVAGGRHFPTDVLVGALLGIAGGIGIPLLHHVLKDDEDGTPIKGVIAPGSVGADGRGLNWTVTF